MVSLVSKIVSCHFELIILMCINSGILSASISLKKKTQISSYMFQHYLVMFGATVANPLALAPHLCIDEDDTLTTSMLIGTIFVCSGLATLLQTALGIR